MFNPFERFQLKFIDAFKKAGKPYLVSQTFKRGMDHFDEPAKEYILLTHYDDLARSQIHLSALKGDKYAAIIDLKNETHLEKIRQMLHPDSKYLVYSTLINSRESIETRLNARYKDNIRRFITKNTEWRIGSDKTIKPQLDLAFGELFIILKYGNQQIRFKLEDLEKA